MIPILYQSITEGTVPTNYGVGPLSDCISGSVKEARNSMYEASFSYAADGIHAAEIQPNRFIKVKPNYTDSPQLFRIYKVGKTINGRFEVACQHISYDLSGKIITSGSANTCVAACALLQTQAGNFIINTDKTVSRAFSIAEPSSVRSWFGGKEGSLLDVYGGEWKYDNYTASLKNSRGADRGVQIRYGKNLTNINQDISIENLVTGIVPFYIDTNGNKTVGTRVPTGLTLDVPRDLAVDFSQDVNPDSGTTITTQLANLAAAYISNHNLTSAFNNITLDFVQLQGLTERVDLCDTVHVYFEPLGITATAKCIETEWDFLEERYTKVTVGSAKTNIADTISVQNKEVAAAASRSFMAEAITHATELITGNLGGYVILHDADGDGYPDEILIMNTPDITTATQVWRWNKNGLGYATTYAGPYGTAITSDGKIVANYVSTGTLNADLIKAGVIEDVGHNSTINMTTGEAKLKNLTAREKLVLVNSSSQERGSWLFNGTECHFAIRDTNLNNVAEMWSNTTGGQIRLSGTNQKFAVGISTDASGGAVGLYYSDGTAKTYLGDNLEIKHSNGNVKAYLGDTFNMYYSNGNSLARIYRNGYGRGVLDLYNEYGSSCATIYGDGGLGLGSGGSFTITGIGSTGVLTCISLVQTSSRKVKENIKPIEDAEKILKLQAVSFDYKNKNLGSNKRGFVAEDVAEILPNLVTPETEDSPASLDYVGMIPYLQDIIKKQESRIRALENKINKIGG